MKKIVGNLLFLIAINAFYQIIVGAGHGAGTLLQFLFGTEFTFYSALLAIPLLIALFSFTIQRPATFNIVVFSTFILCTAYLCYILSGNSASAPLFGLIPFIFWTAFYLFFHFWSQSSKTLVSLHYPELDLPVSLLLIYAGARLVYRFVVSLAIAFQNESLEAGFSYLDLLELCAFIFGILLLNKKNFAGFYVLFFTVSLPIIWQLLMFLVSLFSSPVGIAWFLPYLPDPLLSLVFVFYLFKQIYPLQKGTKTS